MNSRKSAAPNGSTQNKKRKNKKRKHTSKNPYIQAAMECEPDTWISSEMDEAYESLDDFIVCKPGRNYKKHLARYEVKSCLELWWYHYVCNVWQLLLVRFWPLAMMSYTGCLSSEELVSSRAGLHCYPMFAIASADPNFKWWCKHYQLCRWDSLIKRSFGWQSSVSVEMTTLHWVPKVFRHIIARLWVVC